jgi:restriction system protein
MRGYEWEEYLVEVCSALGARVERIGGAGDQGVDLIVELGAERVAVQAKGYVNAVNNKAIQEVYSGMALHRCTACAVITNNRFRKSAFELAESTNCILIGEDEFSDFVLGKRLLRRH